MRSSSRRNGSQHGTAAIVTVLAGLLGCGGSGNDSGDDSSDGTDGGAPLGRVFEGEGTYYDADGSGNCSFPASSDLNVAALNAEQYAGAAYCGACADVSGPDGTLRVRIVDQCPECKHGDLDLSASAFAQIAEPELGRVPISWQVVGCDVSGNLSYQFKDGSSQWWVQVQVRNHRYPIERFEWSADGESWEALERQDHNYFERAEGFGDRSVKIRITASNGAVVEDELPPAQDMLLVEGSVQFAP
ncbi:MAG TPA: expansin EXLX1 family cellulose-binding protein [Polyangiaceae bacterium]|nr:expansin EXLX1 family cellulose-binding protein [Polyangiaceae bacterium]